MKDLFNILCLLKKLKALGIYQNFSVILPWVVYDLPQFIEHLFLGQNSAIAQGQFLINDTRVEHLWFGRKKKDKL